VCDITIKKVAAESYLVEAGTETGDAWLKQQAAASEQSSEEACRLYGEALREGLTVGYEAAEP
jgi:hypothetical protein